MNKVVSYLFEPIIKIFDYKGRATRSQYWIWFGITALWYVTSWLLDMRIFSGKEALQWTMPNLMWLWSICMLVTVISWLVSYLALLSMTMRRMRDANAQLWIFKTHLTGHFITLTGLALVFVNMAFYALAQIGLAIVILFGLVCVILSLGPTSGSQVTAPLPNDSPRSSEPTNS